MKTWDGELTGLVAYPGTIEGIAKVIYGNEDINDFKENEILVANVTKDRMLGIMYMSKAILTQVGTITSHAAINSVKMQKPCIVGVEKLLDNIKTGYLIYIEAKKQLGTGIVFYKNQSI